MSLAGSDRRGRPPRGDVDPRSVW